LGLSNFPDIYRFAFVLPIRFIVYIYLVVCMTLIYLKLVHIDQRSSSLRRTLETSSEIAVVSQTTRPAPPSRTTLNRLTRQFATQALLYCVAFFITWLFPTIGLVVGLVNGGSLPYAILLLSDLFTPLQGFWNAFIYLRPRFLRYRKKLQENEERQRQAQEQAEARRMTRIARLLAQQGLAFVQALSVQNDNDEDDDDEDYLIVRSNADEARVALPESNNDTDFPCSTTPSLNETSSTPGLPVVTTSRQSVEIYIQHEDEKVL
jgi:hypothetical protein